MLAKVGSAPSMAQLHKTPGRSQALARSVRWTPGEPLPKLRILPNTATAGFSNAYTSVCFLLQTGAGESSGPAKWSVASPGR
jgi:hypothetical protein